MRGELVGPTFVGKCSELEWASNFSPFPTSVCSSETGDLALKNMHSTILTFTLLSWQNEP